MRAERLSKQESIAQAINCIEQLAIIRDELRDVIKSFTTAAELATGSRDKKTINTYKQHQATLTHESNEKLSRLLEAIEELGGINRQSEEFLEKRAKAKILVEKVGDDLGYEIRRISTLLFHKGFSLAEWEEKTREKEKELLKRMNEVKGNLYNLLSNL